jgi:FKBP-type peptidyl-prolyl cis-trans isomerase
MITLGKSKYKSIANKNIVQKKVKKKTSHPKYYDEEILSSKNKTSGSSPFYAVFVLICIVSAATIFGVISYQENQQELQDAANNTTTTTTGGGGTTTSTTTQTGTTGGLQAGQTAEIAYKLWIDNDHDGVISYQTAAPDQDDTFTTEVTKGSLINGFYYQLLGMEVGEEKTFEVPPNIDANGDGLDDNTGQEVLGYADPTHELANTKLVFYVKILSIS